MMTPNFDAKQNFDYDEWNQTGRARMQQQLSDNEDVPSGVAGRQRHCVDCGQAIPDGAKFCPSCGREQ